MLGWFSFLWLLSFIGVVGLAIMVVVFAVRRKPKKRIAVALIADTVLCVALFVFIGVNSPPRPQVTGTAVVGSKENIEPSAEPTPSPPAATAAPEPSALPQKEIPVQEISTPVPTAEPAPTVVPETFPAETSVAKNTLLEYRVSEHDVFSAMGNNLIGKRAYVEIPRDIFLSASPSDVKEFISLRYMDKNYNWFTVDFEDGTGLLLNAGVYFLTYGELESDGGISNESNIDLRADENGLFDLSGVPAISETMTTPDYEAIRSAFDEAISSFGGAVISIEPNSDDWRIVTVVVHDEWYLLEKFEKERYCGNLGDYIKQAVVSGGITDSTDYVNVHFDDSHGKEVATSGLLGYTIKE